MIYWFFIIWVLSLIAGFVIATIRAEAKLRDVRAKLDDTSTQLSAVRRIVFGAPKHSHIRSTLMRLLGGGSTPDHYIRVTAADPLTPVPAPVPPTPEGARTTAETPIL